MCSVIAHLILAFSLCIFRETGRQCKYYFLLALTVKNLPAKQETWIWPLGGEGSLEKGMATHCILAWRTPRTEEPGKRQSMGSQSRTQLSEWRLLPRNWKLRWAACSKASDHPVAELRLALDGWWVLSPLRHYGCKHQCFCSIRLGSSQTPIKGC